MLKNEDIICISSIDWDFNWQAHQEIMSTFASNNNRVLFIENTGIRMPRLRDMERIKKRILNWRKGFYGIRQEMDNLYVYSPIALPFPYSNLAKIINRYLLCNVVRKWMKAVNFNNPIIWSFLPNKTTLDLIEHLEAKLVVYYCLDNFSSLTDNKKELNKLESALVMISDLVFTSSDTLTKKWASLNKNCKTFTVGIPNYLIEQAQAKSFSIPGSIKDIPSPIIGYVGGVHKWVDLKLIEIIAKTRPDWSVVFVGPVQCNVTALGSFSNIHFLGEKDYRILHNYINFFDICIIPYTCTDFSNTAYPTKLMLYLALGKPVVAYSTGALKQFSGLIYLADSTTDFLEQINCALNENNKDLTLRRIEIAKKNVWSIKIQEMSELIKNKIYEKRLTEEADWSKRMRRLYQAINKKIIKLVLTLVIAYFLIFQTSLVWFLAEPLKVSDEPQKSDAIVVFAGGVGESGKAGQSYEERVSYAAELYKRGYAKNFIFSSGYTYLFKEPQMMKTLAVSLGIPENAIALENKATNTYENVLFSSEIARHRGWNKILLVSSPYHMRRALLVFKKNAKDIKVISTPILKNIFYSRDFINERGEKIRQQINISQLKGLFHEYASIVYYWIKNWL